MPDFDREAYDYPLPPEAIAQLPAPRRDGSRLLALTGDGLEDHLFTALPELLPEGTLLVQNDTRVVPARLYGEKETGGRVELLRIPDPDFEAQGPTPRARFLARGKLNRPGIRVRVGAALLTFCGRDPDGSAIFELTDGPPLDRLLDTLGSLPLPPYIARPEGPNARDAERYQTVYAAAPGAVAAPTSGLHFTPEVFAALARRGVEVARLTLHVGPGTFQPVRHRDVREHRVLAEPATIPAPLVEAIVRARGRGAPVVAVGTTVVRALEGAALRSPDPTLPAPGAHREDLVIIPGHRFRVVDGLLTNFHLPRSSLLLLVSALAGRERVLQAYAHAVATGYRFYSYGDAMLITPEAVHEAHR